MNGAYRTVLEQLRKTAERRKKSYDQRVRPQKFSEGDWVYYFYPRLRTGRKAKWSRFYTGPYLIVGVLSLGLYRIQKSPRASAIVVHVDKLKLYRGKPLKNWTTAKTDEDQMNFDLDTAGSEDDLRQCPDSEIVEPLDQQSRLNGQERRRRQVGPPRWTKDYCCTEIKTDSSKINCFE